MRRKEVELLKKYVEEFCCAQLVKTNQSIIFIEDLHRIISTRNVVITFFQTFSKDTLGRLIPKKFKRRAFTRNGRTRRAIFACPKREFWKDHFHPAKIRRPYKNV